MEECSEINSEKILILTNNINLFDINCLYFNLSFYMSLFEEKIIINIAV
jgi:hypothetical protein